MNTPIVRLSLSCLFLIGNWHWSSAQIQFPFSGSNPDKPQESAQVPVKVPSDLISPQFATPRKTAAGKVARLFSSELRQIEARQEEIIQHYQELPPPTIESFRSRAWGWHSSFNPKRPKWVQIDLTEVVSPDGIALFPVTVQKRSETIFGYGFPHSFKIKFSNQPDFSSWEEDTYSFDPDNGPQRFPLFIDNLKRREGRYVRIEATNLWRGPDNAQIFALSEIMVFKDERNIAVGKEITVRKFGNDKDAVEDIPHWSIAYINDGNTVFGIPQGKEESSTIGYRSKSDELINESWVQIDLGESMPIQEARIILAENTRKVPNPEVRFPFTLEVQISEFEDLRRASILGDKVPPTQIIKSGNNPLIFTADDPFRNGYGRYVRISITASKRSHVHFSLAELQVYSGNKNVALGKPVEGSHAVISDGYAPEFLVDGFNSHRALISYSDWANNLQQRVALEREWELAKEKRLQLVDSTFTKGMVISITGLIGGISFALMIFSQGRVRRRKDLESLRQRIASDLHDDIGSNLSSIALLAELGKTEASQPELVTEELSEIKLTADKTIESMRDIVWLIRPGEETWKQMMTRFRETASKLLRTHEYSFIEKGHMHDERLPLEFKRDFFLIYKEVLNNVVRHANAKNVSIEVETARGRLDLTIKDDGQGFDRLDSNFREGNGLRNLRMRAQAIGATLSVKSKAESGTIVHLTAPLP